MNDTNHDDLLMIFAPVGGEGWRKGCIREKRCRPGKNPRSTKTGQIIGNVYLCNMYTYNL